MITAKELAEKLGISTAAVSLALNDRPGVSERTRSMVKQQAARYGYHPKGEKKQKKVYGKNIRYVIFLDNGMAVKETSFYSFVLLGIEARAKEFGFNVLVSYFNTEEDWSLQAENLSVNTSGLIILATELREHHMQKMLRNEAVLKQWSRIPVVLVDNTTNLIDLDSVQSDNYRGARMAADYLFSRGFSDVGYLRSTTHITCFDERGAGLEASRKAHGLGEEAPLKVVDVASSSDQAFEDMNRFLDRGGEICSAYFADNDIIAAACIHALKNHGLRVPEDVSVIGFDDMPLCTLFEPPLTTIGVKKTTIGRIAMELLNRRILAGQSAIGEKAPDACMRITISARVIARESVR